MKDSPLVSGSVLWLLLGIVSAASMTRYVLEIWSYNQPPQFSDLYARWWGAHELLLHGRNPYSPAVSHEIQTVIYGAPLSPSPEDPSGIGGGFAYPPYTAFLYWPTVHMSFSAAQKVFVGVSIVTTLLSLALWMYVFRFCGPPLQWLTLALFLLGSFPALQGIKLQNPSLIAAALIAITIFLLSADHLILAGIFLAASTFKPQFMLVLLPWLAIWTLADWRRRLCLAWSFLGTMLLLVLVSEWLVPGWIPSFFQVIRAYSHYTYGHSLLDVWFTPTYGPVASAVLLLVSLAACWAYRSHRADSPGFLVATSLLLAATLVVIPTLAPHAQLLLLPGLLCLLRSRGMASSLTRIPSAAVWILLGWAWVAAFGLSLARIWLPATALFRFWQVPLYASPVLPLAVLLALGGLLFVPPQRGGRAMLWPTETLPGSTTCLPSPTNSKA